MQLLKLLTITLACIYVVQGGMFGDPFGSGSMPQGEEAVRSILRNIFDGVWTPRAPLPLSVAGASSFTIGDRAYVGSGATGEEYCPGELTRDFYVFDMLSNSWSSIAPLPEARVEGTSFSLNGKGYFFGGRNSSCQDVDTLFEYNPDLDEWREIQTASAPPPPQHDLMSFISKGVAYVGLGFAKYGPIRQLYSFDGFDWTPITPAYPISVGATVHFQIKGRTYIGGGIHQDSQTLVVKFYEFQNEHDTPRWQKISSIPAPVGEGISFSIGHFGYAGTGYKDVNTHTYRQELYRYDAEKDSWKLVGNYPEGEHLDGTSFMIGDRAFVGLGLKAYSYEKTSTFYEYQQI